MLTRLAIRNFKLFDKVELELGDRVVLIGPNNAGKTTALQALALWDIGLKRWLEKRGAGAVPGKRPGVTINRRDLIALPVPAAHLLWRDRRVRSGSRKDGKTRTENVCIEIEVEGIHEGIGWRCGLEFDYANEESFYCRPLRGADEQRMAVPEAAGPIALTTAAARSPKRSKRSASNTICRPKKKAGCFILKVRRISLFCWPSPAVCSTRRQNCCKAPMCATWPINRPGRRPIFTACARPGRICWQ